ncbi:hypothetical protein ACETU7_07725 [Rhodococcus sp. 3Y1]
MLEPDHDEAELQNDADDFLSAMVEELESLIDEQYEESLGQFAMDEALRVDRRALATGRDCHLVQFLNQFASVTASGMSSPRFGRNSKRAKLRLGESRVERHRRLAATRASWVVEYRDTRIAKRHPQVKFHGRNRNQALKKYLIRRRR